MVMVIPTYHFLFQGYPREHTLKLEAFSLLFPYLA